METHKMSAPATPQNVQHFFSPQTPSGSSSYTPLKAMFLVKFDVRTGNVVKWSQKVEDSISLKGIEFKSLPSGLHEVERDVISFIQPNGNATKKNFFKDVLYGVSVFQQNLQEVIQDGSRDNVKIYSLGILVDPSSHILPRRSISKISSDLSGWKPINFTSGLEYTDQLVKLLDDWITNNDNENYTTFEEFFSMHSCDLNILDAIGIRSPASMKSEHNPLKLLQKQQHNHHYLLHLSRLLKTLGPLIFRAWKAALLRERILLFDAPNVEVNCAFAYCFSIISTIPQDLFCLLREIGCKNCETLQFIQPIYTVGIDDIDWLKQISDSKEATGFIASSTDEILLFKQKLYDICVQFNQNHCDQGTVPKVSTPGSLSSNPSNEELKCTPRDLKKFKILSKVCKLYDHSQTDLEEEGEETGDEETDFEWWQDVTEPTSWAELAWSGYYWWASAGETGKFDDDLKIDENDKFPNLGEFEIEQSLLIVGYFQSLTRRIFSTIINILNNEEDAVGLNDDGIIIEPNDIDEMGLDSYSKQDSEFVIMLVKKWWDRDAIIGSRMSNFRCC